MYLEFIKCDALEKCKYAILFSFNFLLIYKKYNPHNLVVNNYSKNKTKYKHRKKPVEKCVSLSNEVFEKLLLSLERFFLFNFKKQEQN